MLLVAAALTGCSRPVYGPYLYDADASPLPAQVHEGKIKVHLMSGEMLELTSWQQTEAGLDGYGTRYGCDRKSLGEGHVLVPPDSIALLESQVQVGTRPNAAPGMVVWSVITGVITIHCVSDPKACFGSCPTFYVETERGEALAAEGFSESIARVLEARDLDALFPAHTSGGEFVLTMRNEALETHAVRGLELHAVPRPTGGRVLASAGGALHPASGFREPLSCLAREGDCLEMLRAPDGIERKSAADSLDLATPETIELTFPAASGRLGLVLGARQSLLGTYLFYETMGFLGSHAGEALAQLERGGREEAERALGMARRIGPIEVEVLGENGWEAIGVHWEAGPLARNFEVVPFHRSETGPVRVRLTASRGAWRIDWVALAELGEVIEPVTLAPETVLREGRFDPTAFGLLEDPDAHLVTYPGDSYDVVFSLPEIEGQWELFLESEGFYYEWMRPEWLADENPALAALALYDPASALRVLAPDYKRAEPEMEERFWSSRFRR